MTTLQEQNEAYLAAKIDPIVGPILDALHVQDACTYNGRAGSIETLARQTAGKVEAAIRADERSRLASVLDADAEILATFANGTLEMVRLIAYMLRNAPTERRADDG